MRQLSFMSPMRLINRLAAVWCLLIVSDTAVVFVSWKWLAFHPVLRGQLSVVLALCGWASWSWIQGRLEKGIQKRTWNGEELEALRSWINHPSVLIAACIPVAVCICSMMAVRPQHDFAMAWLAFLPLSAVARLRYILAPRRWDWANAAVISLALGGVGVAIVMYHALGLQP